jgi:hypothetical protein
VQRFTCIVYFVEEIKETVHPAIKLLKIVMLITANKKFTIIFTNYT